MIIEKYRSCVDVCLCDKQEAESIDTEKKLSLKRKKFHVCVYLYLYMCVFLMNIYVCEFISKNFNTKLYFYIFERKSDRATNGKNS